MINSIAEAQVATASDSANDLTTLKQLFDSLRQSAKDFSELFWEHIPKGTKSFVITICDEDAPKGNSYWHWLIIETDLNRLKLEAKECSLMKNEASICTRPRYFPA